MNIREAIYHAHRLHSIWVSDSDIKSGKGYDLDRIRQSIRSEMKADRERPARSTSAKKRETRGHAILLGKVRKALS